MDDPAGGQPEAGCRLGRPGVAALTAGPGITNGLSAITSAFFCGSPMVVIGGRAPAARWIAPSTPPPPARAWLAAFTTASTCSCVMSPSTASTRTAVTLRLSPVSHCTVFGRKNALCAHLLTIRARDSGFSLQ